MKNSLFFLFILFSACKSSSQDADLNTGNCTKLPNEAQRKLVGQPCEGCEAIFEYDNPHINAVDTLPDFNNHGPKIKITGTVYQPGGKTPACGVVLYVYHTNQDGIYPTKGNETGWQKRHGYIRGWVRTDKNGKYTFYTLKPGHYPGRTSAAHIHPTILEPNGKYYWINAYLFNGDPLIKPEQISRTPRGGNDCIITLKQEGELLVGERDIELGKNIPNYD